jgi:hypothetical protein
MFRVKALRREVCCGGLENYMSFYDHVTKIKPIRDGFNQNKVYTKNVNHIIEYINTIIQKTTTHTSTNQHISTLCCYYLKLHLSHYSGLDIIIMLICIKYYFYLTLS